MTDRVELTDAAWRKSSYSGAEGDCVEVADNLGGVVAVRDSKDPDGPVLTLAPGPWRQFVQGVQRGSDR